MTSKSTLLIVFASILGAFAQLTADCNGLAYQAASNPSEQFGYNVCNSTTEGQSSRCQTLFINAIDDFCLWGPANPVTDLPLNDNQVQQVVAWCTRPGHGARVIPPNTLNVSIFIQTPNYVEILGWFDESFINYPVVRSLSSYSATEWPAVNITAQLTSQGGPTGGLVFSNAFGTTNAKSWLSIVGEGGFMIRACDPTIAGSDAYCTPWPGDTYWSWFEFFDTSAFPGHATSVSNGYQSCTGPSLPIGAYVGADNTTQTYTGGNPPSMVPVNVQAASCTAYNSQDIFPTTFATTSTQICATTLQASQIQSSSGHSSSGARAGAIAGAIVGVIGLIALVSLLFIWRRRRNRQPPSSELDTNVNPNPFMSERTTNSQPSREIRKAPLPTVDETSPRPSGTGTSPLSPRTDAGTSNLGDILSRQTRSTFPRVTSTVGGSSIIQGLPPAYSEVSDPPPSVGPGSELAMWAQDNRDVISPDLEARLREAHYLPSDNPDEIPQDVWARDYGIRHFELKRLRQLYAQRGEGASSVG